MTTLVNYLRQIKYICKTCDCFPREQQQQQLHHHQPAEDDEVGDIDRLCTRSVIYRPVVVSRRVEPYRKLI